MIEAVVLIGSVLAYCGACYKDEAASEKGYAKGFEEQNPIVKKLFGSKPPVSSLTLYNTAWAALMMCPAMFLQTPAYIWASSGILAGAAGKHMMSVRRWGKVEAGTYKAPSSAFAKFLGL